MCNGNCKQGRECDCEFTVRTITGESLTLVNKPDYNITFFQDGKQIGSLDFNGPEMKFEGEAEEGAKTFFKWIAESFSGRLAEEREAGMSQAIAICDKVVNSGGDAHTCVEKLVLAKARAR